MRTEDREGWVIVTGASSGIGLTLVKSLLASQYRVLGIARHFDDPVGDHERFRMQFMDLSDIDGLPAQLTELVDSIEEPVRALVNNAGVGKVGQLEQLSYDDIRVVMDVNYLSHAMVTKAFLPHFKKQGSGDIIFTGSESALRGSTQGTAYCASKFALRGFAQALRKECARAGVRVSLINPGATRTAFFDDLHYQPGADEGNAIEPEDVAEMILALLQLRPGTVIDEINLSPLSQVWERKRR